jgi:hypothetical protein
MSMKITTGTADAALQAVGNLLNAGSIYIYSGTEPTTASTALSGNTVLANLAFPATAFPVVGGTSPTTDDVDATARKVVAGTIASVTAAASGTATFFRCYKSTGQTTSDVVYQGTCGTSGQQLNLNDTSIISGGNVSITSLKITLPTA